MATRSASSLALLQERFNKLQKTREMRQEKELLRFISHAAAIHYKPPPPANSCYYYDSDELIMFQRLQQSPAPPSPPAGFSLVRTPPPPPPPIVHRPVAVEASEEIAKSLLLGTKNLLGLYNSSSPQFFQHDSCKSPHPDVDTSLHL